MITIRGPKRSWVVRYIIALLQHSWRRIEMKTPRISVERHSRADRSEKMKTDFEKNNWRLETHEQNLSRVWGSWMAMEMLVGHYDWLSSFPSSSPTQQIHPVKPRFLPLFTLGKGLIFPILILLWTLSSQHSNSKGQRSGSWTIILGVENAKFWC